MQHHSTVEQRSQWIAELMQQERRHGRVSELSREHQVPRQTLYRWKAKAEQALQAIFSPAANPKKQGAGLHRAVLTLFVEGHSSYRGMQTCIKELLGEDISPADISAIINTAGKIAQELLEKQKTINECSVALDEQYSNKRGEAHLNIVDAHSTLVWATTPAVPVDTDSWMILLWYMQEQGVNWKTAASDGGGAISGALGAVRATSRHQRDEWHILDFGSHIQRHVDRYLVKLQEQLPAVHRQAERVAQGKKPLGANPRTDIREHEAQIKQVEYIANALRYLLSQLHEYLEIVVLGPTREPGILDSESREAEIETVLQLMLDLEKEAPTAIKLEIHRLYKHVQSALPRLLLFARDLDQIQQIVRSARGDEAVHLMAWAWQRRRILGPSRASLLEGLAANWRPMAEQLFSAWDRAVRASSAVENWHSILRPHLAVHRGLSGPMLALLAVRHNYRIAPRGIHAGLSPMQRSGIEQSTTDWLTALGYAPQAA